MEVVEVDQAYRKLLEEHGHTVEARNLGILTMERTQEAKHQIQRAIADMAGRDNDCGVSNKAN